MKLSSPHMISAMGLCKASALANGLVRTPEEAQDGIHRSLLAAQALRRREEEKDAKAKAAADLISKVALKENPTVPAEQKLLDSKAAVAEYIASKIARAKNSAVHVKQELGEVGHVSGAMNFTTKEESAHIDVGVVAKTYAGGQDRTQECEDCIHCDGGDEHDVDGNPTGKTCEVACDGHCCVGDKACNGFKGKMKKLGECSGYKACYNANIDYVSNACNGYYACEFAGSDGGSITSVVSSCNSVLACYDLAQDGGSVGEINNSCNDVQACNNLARGRGSVRDINGSCNYYFACIGLAEERGTVEDIEKSCDSFYACAFLAQDGGSVEDINNSCNFVQSCGKLAYDGGTVRDINYSCNQGIACRYLAQDGGTVGDINDSCNSYVACQYLAEKMGTVGDIKKSCNEYFACSTLGYDGGNVEIIKECCNSEDFICVGVDSDAKLFEKDLTCKTIPVLLKEALVLIEKEQGESKYSQAVLCNVETLLQLALVDVQGVAYAVDQAMSQLGCSLLCDKLFETKDRVMGGVNDEL